MKTSLLLISGLAFLSISPNISAQSIPSHPSIFQRPSSLTADKTFQHSTESSSLSQINSVSSLSDGLFAGNPREGNGLFNGSYGAVGQLTWDITDNFAVAGIYAHAYATQGRFGFNYNGLGVTGTAVANTLAGQDLLSSVISNGYGANVSWQANDWLVLNGWFSTIYSRLIGQGDGNILTYAVNIGFPDLGKEGNLLVVECLNDVHV